MNPAVPPRRACGHRWAMLAVCLAAASLRIQGINWPVFHPDEPRIGIWLVKAATGRPQKDCLYPGGFFQLAKPLLRLEDRRLAVAQALGRLRGMAPRDIGAERADPVLTARWFNLWASVLACLAVYGFVRRLARGPWPGVFAAAWLAVLPLAVEHSHYAESDIAMLLTLTVFLWLAAVALDRRAIGWRLLAALAGGFAAGTKFTMLALLPLVPVLALLPPADGARRPAAQAAAVLAAALAVFALGFVLATPVALDFGWFAEQWTAEHQRVFGETALNLGPLRDVRGIRVATHASLFVAALGTLGIAGLALAGGGLLGLAHPARARFWPVLLLFPLLYFWYWMALAPWVRSQEFLAFLPVLAAWAALALQRLWQGGLGRRLLALALAAASLGAGALESRRLATVFSWPDTRLAARAWLERTLPDGAGVACEQYAGEACPASGVRPLGIRKIEREGWAYVTGGGADYLLRAATVTGRGLVDPLTGQRYPGAQAEFDRLRREGERLRVWATLPPYRTTFGSPVIELYGLRAPPRCGASLALDLPQPAWVVNYVNHLALPFTASPVGRQLGPAQAMLVDSRPRTLAIGGPDTPAGPVYLVCHTEARPATLTIRGFARRRRVALDPYGAAIVPLERPRWRPRAGAYEFVTVAADPRPDVLFLPCYVRVAFSAEQAVRLCRDVDADAAVWACFDDDALARLDAPETVYGLAVRAGRWALADRVAPSAERAAHRLDKALAVAPASLRIQGTSGFHYDALARARPQEPDQWCLALDCCEPAEPEPPPPDTVGRLPRAPHRGTLVLPVRVARGWYRFRGEVLANRPDPGTAARRGPLMLEVAEGEFEPATWTLLGLSPGQWVPFDTAFAVSSDRHVAWRVRCAEPVTVTFRNTEIVWTLGDVLRACRDDLAAARAAHAIHDGRPDEALRLLARQPGAPTPWNLAEWRRLELDAQLGSNASGETVAAAAARRLQTAPWDAVARAVLGSAPAAVSRSRNVTFGSRLRLIGFSWDAAARRAQGVVEACKPDTAPLAAAFWIRRHGAWRRQLAQPLAPGRRLDRGERLSFDVVLAAPAAAAPDDWALGFETDVVWHPGLLPADGNPDPVIPFAALLAAEPAR